jgi:hypothetical protein
MQYVAPNHQSRPLSSTKDYQEREREREGWKKVKERERKREEPTKGTKNMIA